MDRTPGNWKPGKLNHGVIVTDEIIIERYRTPLFDPIESMNYEFEKYGGYIIAESISNHTDLKLMSNAGLMFDAIQQFCDGLDRYDKQEVINAILQMRTLILEIAPPPKLITQYSTLTAKEIK